MLFPVWRKANSFPSANHTNPTIEAYYHAAQMIGLAPGKTCFYRVGNDPYWSEWFQVTLPDPDANGISFIYLGDAQNGVRDHWSRLIRQAYKHHPQAAFSLHAGDLINRHDYDFYNSNLRCTLGISPWVLIAIMVNTAKTKKIRSNA